MAFKKKTALVTFTLICSFILIAISSNVFAENRWILLHSKTGAYSVKIPNEYEVTVEGIRVAPTAKARSEKLTAIIDQRPYKDVIKTFTVEAHQTIGTPFTLSEFKKMIKYDLDRYTNFYEKYDASIKYSKRTNDYGVNIHELFISYKDPEHGPQNVRVATFTSNVTKYLQTFSGPSGSMFEVKVDAFFKEIKVNYGIAKSKGSFKEDWKEYPSPNNIFTAYFPPPTEKYGDREPTIVNNEFNERISYTFNDPARRQKLLYRISSYKTDRNLRSSHAEQILRKNHLRGHRQVKNKINFKSEKVPNNILAVKADIEVTGTEKMPYKSLVKLYSEVSGKYMIVHEFIGSHQLVRSGFVQKLIDLTHFHPEKAELAEIMKEEAMKEKAMKEEPVGEEQ